MSHCLLLARLVPCHIPPRSPGIAQLEAELYDRSDPDSPNYAKWMTNAAVHSLVAPSAAHRAAVDAHLALHGVDASAIQYPTPNGDFVVATVGVRKAEAILGGGNVQYTQLRHEATGATCVRLLPHHTVALPADLAEAVVMVEPTHRMPPVSNKARVTPGLLGNDPESLRKLYNVTEVGAAGGKNPTGHAVTAFLAQYYSESDFTSFWSQYGKDGTGVSKPSVKLVGDATTGQGGVESMLDIEYINSLGAGIHSEFWGFAGHAANPANEPFLKWLYTMGNTSDATIPKVFSTSYGEDEKSTDVPDADRMNVEFMKAGARGISLMYASGDEGANCKGGVYVPEWPSSSPYITAVGGTTDGEGGGGGDERAAALSSGGFSNRYGAPAYQKSAIAAYLKAGATTSGFPKSKLYNASGRAYPDVSAQATGFTVVAGGGVQPGVAGTSCASPTFSGVVGLLVDARLAAGKTSLGFLNPLLYKQGGLNVAMNDITSGSAGGCAIFDNNGWPALQGWDAVTGWGSPNFGAMKAVVLALQ